MTGIVFIYVTHPDPAGAAKLGRDLVESGLAACVNMVAGMNTIYRWQGQIVSGQEVAMIVKTREALFGAIAVFVRERHPYDCPCIAALPVVNGDAAYLEWIAQSSVACDDAG